MVAVGVLITNTGCELSTTPWYSTDRVPETASLVELVVGRLHPVAGGGEGKRCKFLLDKQYRIYYICIHTDLIILGSIVYDIIPRILELTKASFPVTN